MFNPLTTGLFLQFLAVFREHVKLLSLETGLLDCIVKWQYLCRGDIFAVVMTPKYTGEHKILELTSGSSYDTIQEILQTGTFSFYEDLQGTIIMTKNKQDQPEGRLSAFHWLVKEKKMEFVRTC